MDASKKQREPVAFKSLAELKRFIRPGVEFKTVSHANHADMVGLTRVVTTVQTVGFYSKIKDQPEHPFSTCNHGKDFYTDFGKAGNYIFDGTTVKVKDARKQDRGVICELEFYDRKQNMEETMMDRKMVNFIREQYPPGTRIRLNSMEDPYAPIAPGTEGEVDFVDDICCASPVGYNAFGQQFERVLPASSVANLYPFNYSGKTDAKGFYVGRDKYGSNILVDFDQRDEDKTSANILILGNSGQGKSYLMKLLILNLLESGKSVITLDAEHEQQEMCEAVGGCFADLMAGKYIINVLEPKCWDDGGDPDDTAAPEAFRKSTLLAQHVSFLKDFFRAYKDFSDAHIDTIEIMVSKLYAKWGITERTNFRRMRPEDYPILFDLYDLIEEEFKRYDPNAHLLYTEKLLQEVLLGLHSMCKGADAQFFNGHTNLTSSRFLVFGVKGMLSAAKNVRNAMLFNVLSFMSDKLLTVGNTVAALDELYIWLSNPTAIEYIRNCLKRVRKKESAMLLASQNLEDFDQEGIREMTKPLFSIPPHQFLFNAGSIDKRSYMEMLQLDEAEYNLIKFPQRGVCLYKCGNERYLLEVHAPAYKEKLFGTAGGR